MSAALKPERSCVRRRSLAAWAISPMLIRNTTALRASPSVAVTALISYSSRCSGVGSPGPRSPVGQPSHGDRPYYYLLIVAQLAVKSCYPYMQGAEARLTRTTIGVTRRGGQREAADGTRVRTTDRLGSSRN